MKRHYSEFLRDIILEINFIKDATKGISFNEFKQSPLLTRAITRSLEIIGEAVFNIPNEIKEKYSTIPWRSIKDFRNIIIHQYWSVDYIAEWLVIETKLNLLEKQIKEVLKKEKISINKK